MPSFSIQRALLGLPPDLQEPISYRLKLFANKLFRQAQLECRDDSRLIWSLVNGELSEDWNENKVIDELCVTKYLHDHTNYENEYKCTIPVVKQNIEQQIFSEYSDSSIKAHEYVQKFVIPLYRIKSILDIHPNGKLASPWPWIKPTFSMTEVMNIAQDVFQKVPVDKNESIHDCFAQTLELVSKEKLMSNENLTNH